MFAAAVTLVASVAVATAIFAVPSKEVPPIVRALANAVAVAALPVAEPALPETLPVTSPVNGPAKASEVTVPSKNASLNSTELVPKSISLSVEGTIAPSINVT